MGHITKCSLFKGSMVIPYKVILSTIHPSKKQKKNTKKLRKKEKQISKITTKQYTSDCGIVTKLESRHLRSVSVLNYIRRVSTIWPRKSYLMNILHLAMSFFKKNAKKQTLI